METYKLNQTASQLKLYVAVITYGSCATIVNLEDTNGGEMEIARSAGTTPDGMGTFNYNGDIPDMNVGKNNSLENHYINFYIKVDVAHLPQHLKTTVKTFLLKSGLEVGLSGGNEGSKKFGLKEEDFDNQTVTDIYSIVKSIKLIS